MIDHATDLRIHQLHHRRVDLHPPRILQTPFFRAFGPGCGVVGEPAWKPGVLPERRTLGNQAKRRLPLGASLAGGHRPGCVGAPVAVQPVVRHLQRVVGRGEGQVGEKRGAGVALLQMAEQRIGVGRARIEVARQFIHRPAVLDVLRYFHRRNFLLIGEVAGAAGEQRERPLKPPPVRPLRPFVGEVPFARHERLVAALGQRLRQGDDAVVQLPLVVDAHLVRGPQAGLHAKAGQVVIDAGHEHGARRCAGGRDIVAREQRAGLR